MTIQEKFDAGYVFTHIDETTVVEMHTFKKGAICVVYNDGSAVSYDNEREFICDHTENPPVEKIFTPLFEIYDNIYIGAYFGTLEEAQKGSNDGTTCILEHHKINNKWVAIRLHTIE